jgi:hypothetical protein
MCYLGACHCALCKTEVQERACESLRSNFEFFFLHFFGIRLEVEGNVTEVATPCNSLQRGLKIDIHISL